MHTSNVTPFSTGFVRCTSEQWADYLSDLRTYATEDTWRGNGVMLCKLSPYGGYPKPGRIVGEVHYLPTGERQYFIPNHAASPTELEA